MNIIAITAFALSVISLPALAESPVGARSISDNRVETNSMVDHYGGHEPLLVQRKKTSSSAMESSSADLSEEGVAGASKRDIEAEINTDRKAGGFEADMDGAAGSTLGAESSGGLRGGASLSVEQ